MANLNSDTIEEDAADLQFPKVPDWTSEKHRNTLEITVRNKAIFTLDSTCFTCSCLITEPYIHCAVCEYVLLCAPCFAKGQEKTCHKNHHSYMIIKNDFPLFGDSGWTAKEEINLLNLIQENGFGNWKDISRCLPEKSPYECKKHYLKYYVDNQFVKGLPYFEENSTTLFGSDSTTYNLKVEDVEDPPRFTPGTINFKLMAGYNPCRSDFEVNFDNHAELAISNLKYAEFSSNDFFQKLGQNLQIALVGAYNFRLKERFRRRKVIKDHGLISSTKTLSSSQRYDATITRSLVYRFRIFAQLVSGIEFDSIIECLHKIGEVKNRLRHLFNYRKNGIKHFYSIPMFKELTSFRQEIEKERKQDIYNIENSWRNFIPNVVNESHSISNHSRRKTAPPLDIHPGMIGYNKLSLNEKDLCSIARILPDVYIDIKHLLINENKKYGSIKLAQARQLLKIDVNKTKKIYEFFIKEGYINVN